MPIQDDSRNVRAPAQLVRSCRESFSRREFLRLSGLGLLAACGMDAPLDARASEAPAIGLQLYSLTADLRKDLPGTLRAIAAMGYRHVELAETFGLQAAELRAILGKAGLECISGHFGGRALSEDPKGQLAYARELGLQYVICPDLWVANPERFDAAPRSAGLSRYEVVVRNFTAADWEWNANFFNRLGKLTREAGMRFGFHNHLHELRGGKGESGYDRLLLLTDPHLVTMELDCGWMTAAGIDPSDYLRRHPDRFELLHIKDVLSTGIQPGEGPPLFGEIGTGIVDWKRVLASARAARVRHSYVEIEPPFEKPPLESLSNSLAYLRSLGP